MDAEYRNERGVDWWTGIKVAMGVAAVFLLVTRGIPWAGSGAVSPTVMGREIKYPGDINAEATMTAMLLHFGAAALYAMIMMPLIHRFRFQNGWMVGAVLGIILYAANLAIASLLGGAPYSREMPVLITHLAFALAFTGGYKGLVKRRIGVPQDA